MKWIIALLVSVGMFFAGYYHAARYVADSDTQEPTPEDAGETSPPASEPEATTP